MVSSRPVHSSVLVLVMTLVTSHTAQHDAFVQQFRLVGRVLLILTLFFVLGSIQYRTWMGLGLVMVFLVSVSAVLTPSTLEYSNIKIDNEKRQTSVCLCPVVRTQAVHVDPFSLRKEHEVLPSVAPYWKECVSVFRSCWWDTWVWLCVGVWWAPSSQNLGLWALESWELFHLFI